MVVVMLQEVKVAPFAPESNRERLLYADYASIYNLKDGPDWNSNGGMSVELAERLYKDLTIRRRLFRFMLMIHNRLPHRFRDSRRSR